MVIRLTGICEIFAKTEESLQKHETIWKLRNYLEFAEHSDTNKSGKCAIIWKMRNI